MNRRRSTLPPPRLIMSFKEILMALLEAEEGLEQVNAAQMSEIISKICIRMVVSPGFNNGLMAHGFDRLDKRLKQLKAMGKKRTKKGKR